jgi:RND family efflux transporter MFP subunit
MSPRKRIWFFFLAGLLVVAALVGSYVLGRSHTKGSGAEASVGDAEKVIATVKVVAAEKGTLESRISAFGSIVPAPGAAQTVSVAYECRVASILVSEGQVVATGTPLLTVTNSPDAQLEWEQARIDERAAETQLDQTRNRHALKLADNGQLAQAQQAFATAQARVKSLEDRHMGGAQVLRAKGPGVVTKIPVQVSAVVPSGSSLAELADTQRLEARLGVEPQDALHLRAGAALTLAVVDGKAAATAQARIRTVSPAINPTTRLMDVFVSLPPAHPFLLGQYVHGKVVASAHDGWLVPYAAVLPDEGRQVLFTVKNSHAVRHEVHILVQSEDRLQVAGPDFDASEPVVVQGNYELQNGMAVRVEQGP